MEIKNVLGRGVSPYLQNRVEAGETASAENASRARAAQTQAANGTDTVSISESAKLQSLAVREATVSTDVRTEKVEELKARVKDGSYKPDSKAIAQGIIRAEAGFITQAS